MTIHQCRENSDETKQQHNLTSGTAAVHTTPNARQGKQKTMTKSRTINKLQTEIYTLIILSSKVYCECYLFTMLLVLGAFVL